MWDSTQPPHVAQESKWAAIESNSASPTLPAQKLVSCNRSGQAEPCLDAGVVGMETRSVIVAACPSNSLPIAAAFLGRLFVDRVAEPVTHAFLDSRHGDGNRVRRDSKVRRDMPRGLAVLAHPAEEFMIAF